MDGKALFQRHKAIQKLLGIEKEYEGISNSKRLFPLRDWTKPDTSDERSQVKVQELGAQSKEILQIYGRNLKIEEIKNIYDSEPWSKGFNPGTSLLIKRYNYLTYSNEVYESLSILSDKIFKTFWTSDVISQSTLSEIINDFKTPDAIINAREHFSNVFNAARIKIKDKSMGTGALAKASSKETRDDHMASYRIAKHTWIETISNSIVSFWIPMTSQKETTDGSMGKNTIFKRPQEASGNQELKDATVSQENRPNDSQVIKNIPCETKKSNTDIKTSNSLHKSPNSFPLFLCKRTDVFMFPSFPVDEDGNMSRAADVLTCYRLACLKLATDTSIEVMEFCKMAKVGSAMTITLFEELFYQLQLHLPSSPLEREYGKKLMQEIFAELYVMECEIVEQKRRCTKFLIDVDVLLYYDSPLPNDDSGSWKVQQQYIWKLVITRSELAIKLLEILMNKLKEAQHEFILQYKGFLAFCKTYPDELSVKKYRNVNLLCS